MTISPADNWPGPAAERDKVFFAIRPAPEDARWVRDFAAARLRRRGVTAPLVASGRLHISLNPVHTERVIDKALEAAATVAARPFVVAFNRLGTWGRGVGRRPVVFWGDDGVIGIYALHAAIHAALADAGAAPPREREIVPHMTVLRDQAAAPQMFIDPVHWTVRDFALLRSRRGEPAYRVLGRWPLVG